MLDIGIFPILYNGLGDVPPRLPLSLRRFGPPPNTWFLGPTQVHTRVHTPNSAVWKYGFENWINLFYFTFVFFLSLLFTNHLQLSFCSILWHLGLQLSKNDTLMVLRVLIQATFLLLFHSCYAVQNSTIVGLVEVFPAEIPSDST